MRQRSQSAGAVPADLVSIHKQHLRANEFAPTIFPLQSTVYMDTN